MSMVATGFAVGGAAGLLTAVVSVIVPGCVRSWVTGVGTAIAGTAGLAAGVAALAGETFAQTWPSVLPLSGIVAAVDPLGGLFLAVTGGVAVVAGIYGIGYARHGVNARTASAALPLFVVAMLLVPAAASVGTFLVCWELMALLSLLLVLSEHRRRPEVASAGRWYAVMTHLGFVTILAGLLVFVAHAGGDSFAMLRQAGQHLPRGTGDLVFVLTLLGFSSKAGILPWHAWLPRAHPEAPSHVSALMSAAMVNLGVYGIVRVGFDLLGGGPRRGGGGDPLWGYRPVNPCGGASTLSFFGLEPVR